MKISSSPSLPALGGLPSYDTPSNSAFASLRACLESLLSSEATNHEEARIEFYDQLSPFYHLLYKDWEAGMVWQAEHLRDIIRAQWGEQVQSVLDVSCGIGTQSLGLARLGFQVTASDLSPHAIARAKKEAQVRNLTVSFSVCDMREAYRTRPFEQ